MFQSKYNVALLHKNAKKLLNVAMTAQNLLLQFEQNLSIQHQFEKQSGKDKPKYGIFAKAEADYNKAIAQLVPDLEAAKELDLPGLERGGIGPYEMFTGKRFNPNTLDMVLEKALLQDCANMELIIYEGKCPADEMEDLLCDSEDDF